MGKTRVFLNKSELFSLLYKKFFFVGRKTWSIRVSNQFIFDSCECLRDFLTNEKKNLWLEKFQILS